MHAGLVRHVLSPLLERLRGRDTFARAAELRASQWWPTDRIRQHQAERLAALLSDARNTCLYYSRVLGKAKFAVGCSPLEMLADLPMLDKSTIRRNLSNLTNHSVPGGPIPFNTGGSTGEPLVFHVDRYRTACDRAARIVTHEWFDASPGDREVYLWGSPVELRAQDRAKKLRDRLTNELLLSAFDLSPSSMNDYLARMRAFDPVSVFGYPSSLDKFARHCLSGRNTYDGKSLRVVFTTGETLDPDQRASLGRFFGVRIADGYGSRDGGFIAHECPHGRLHVLDQHLIVEITDDCGRPLPPGETGEIVITHLEARATPLIRYRTGDIGSISEEPCPCGRGMTVLGAVAGRRTDHLVSASGARQHGLSAMYVIRELNSVRKYQVHQRTDRSVEVLIVPEPGFGEEDRKRIQRGLNRQLGPDIPVTIRTVTEIISANSGKFRPVISDVLDVETSPTA